MRFQCAPQGGGHVLSGHRFFDKRIDAGTFNFELHVVVDLAVFADHRIGVQANARAHSPIVV